MIDGKSKAERVIRFFEKCLVHTKGKQSGKPFLLLDWQKEIIYDLYGTLRADGLRRYRTAYLEIPRKQGKSTLIAGLSLYELLFGEHGGECYICANNREQARILFSIAADMVSASKVLRNRLTIYKSIISNSKSRSILKVLSRDAVSALGVNASFCVMDELLGAPDDALYNSMATSMGARAQPLLIMITTAGFSRQSFCYQMHEYAERVRTGESVDEAFYSKIYGIREGESWHDREIWKRCNPSLGHTVDIEYFEQHYKRAIEFPSYEYAFRVYYLNEWLSIEKNWISADMWATCEDTTISLSDFEGSACYVGLDLASVSDLTGLALAFHRDGKYYLFAYGFVPEEGIELRSRKDKVPYKLWRDAGHLISTPGNATDYDYILNKLVELSTKHDIKEVAVDRWNSSYLTTKLQEHGFNVVGFGQSYSAMTSPIKFTERAVKSGILAHDGNPVLAWCVSNVVLKMDPAGGVKTDKRKSKEKIDLAQASLMALERCSAANTESPLNSELVWA